VDSVIDVIALPEAVHAAPLLGAISAQAAAADASRTIDPGVIAAIKASPLMQLSASDDLGGLEATVAAQAWELAAVAAACGSTAWCLWNHLCVFHLYCGALGPDHRDLLAGIVAAGEWVCFPGGAGSRVYGLPHGDVVTLDGRGTFGSGCRYAEWTAVAFALGDGTTPARPEDIRFTVVRLDQPGISIDPTWDGLAVRASSTDTIHYAEVTVPVDRCVPWFAANRAEAYRDPTLPMLAPRYREDWVGLSDLWLAAMAVGTVGAALADAVAGIVGRKAIMGAAMAQLPAVQANLGQVASHLSTARLALQAACEEVDGRIATEVLPTEADYQRQAAVSVVVIGLCQQAMELLLRTLGGNGLREGGSFERRWRDVAAMGVHINAHPDRVWSRLGQLLLDQPLNRF
jgi:3-hydroxy-9,10-secoandrosta-1,3,5(10)-triene-9,17-dione monooxygenase